MASPRTQRLSLEMYRRSCDRKSITVTPLLIPPNTRKHELECRCAITSLEPNGGHHDGGYHLVIRGHGFLLGLPARQHKENPEDNDDQDYADDVFLDIKPNSMNNYGIMDFSLSYALYPDTHTSEPAPSISGCSQR